MRASVFLLCCLAACTRETAKPVADSSSPRRVPVAPAIATMGDCSLPSSDATVSGVGIGKFRIGMSVDDVHRVCHVIRDTTTLGGEAQPERVVSVDVGGDTLNATIDSGRVWRIVVDHPSVSTNDSLSVGVTLGRLLQRGDATGVEGEDALYVQLANHCGLSFRIAHEIGAREHKQEWNARDLRRIPQESLVDEILVTGCP